MITRSQIITIMASIVVVASITFVTSFTVIKGDNEKLINNQTKQNPYILAADHSSASFNKIVSNECSPAKQLNENNTISKRCTTVETNPILSLEDLQHMTRYQF